ncbi:MAG: 50S ribosomal protein L25/general stress protein Ctc [Candidatus Polarisedimenticolaceae bacterium]|nr:50S ribosomal protein L25/general stress protein Ctc [Candidatus Polarisedimenticolaceae bacterium]
MSTNFVVTAESRTDTGKGASRRLRHAGLVPGIIYGAHKEPAMITLNHNALLLLLDNEAFYSHILELKVGKKSEQVILKDLQRHPAKPFIMHIDFQRISAKENIKVHVPLHFTGEDSAPGVKAGGIISHNMSGIEITCLPKDLPEFIEVDISALEVGQSIHLSEVALPKGVELAHATDANNPPVAAIHNKGGAEEEESSETGDEEEAAE